MMQPPALQGSNDGHAKALAINLEASLYGTFAEIGAGQEVARWFLSVGAASGTVAEAVSAYDKTVSDDKYGAGTRYVSKERLLAMLDHEYQQLISRLDKQRGATTRFFAFADTVATRNYAGTNEQHGWLGLRFQAEPGAAPNQVLLHVSLLDSTAQLQQEAIGTLGVNLIYAARHQRTSSQEFLTGLFDDLTVHRVEIDVLEFSGPEFQGDSRLWGLDLLKMGMAPALVFDARAQLVEPATPLHKRPLIIERTLAGQAGPFAAEAFAAAREKLALEKAVLSHDPVLVFEISTLKLSSAVASDNVALLALVETLAAKGTVMVTSFPEGHEALTYVRRYTAEPVRVIIWISMFLELMAERVFNASPGALLEAFGRLFSTDVTIYVAPMHKQMLAATAGEPTEKVLLESSGESVGLDDFHPRPPLGHLFRYLRDAGHILPLEKAPASA
jgi:hypothetical protein